MKEMMKIQFKIFKWISIRRKVYRINKVL